jgi:hypothetical protein
LYARCCESRDKIFEEYKESKEYEEFKEFKVAASPECALLTPGSSPGTPRTPSNPFRFESAVEGTRLFDNAQTPPTKPVE